MWVRTAFETASGRAAFGEDGIDLKGVRKRTPDAKDETIVCDNVIWGHTSHGYTGITVNDGSQGVYIFRNRIFQNSVGIYVSNSESDGWYRAADALAHPVTQDVYIYRNLVYMNETYGVLIASGEVITSPLGDHHWQVSNVYLVNNTIAHNLWAGVFVQNETGRSARAADVERVYLYNNLIARNDRGSTTAGEFNQVKWSAAADLSDPSRLFRS